MGPKRKIVTETEENVKKRNPRAASVRTVSECTRQRKAAEPAKKQMKVTSVKRCNSTNIPEAKSELFRKGKNLKNSRKAVDPTTSGGSAALRSSKKKVAVMPQEKVRASSQSGESDIEEPVVVKKRKKVGNLAMNVSSSTSDSCHNPSIINVVENPVQHSKKNARMPLKNGNELEASSSSESEWEEVSEDDSQCVDEYEPEIPKEGVEITLEGPRVVRKREKKPFDLMGYIRCQINREKKEQQLVVHQVHLLCLLARGLYINNTINSDEVKGIALSLIPVEFLNITVSSANVEHVKKLLTWFRTSFVLDSSCKHSIDIKKRICKCFEHQKAPSAFEYNIMFVAIARMLKFKVRLCISFYPVSFKPTDLLKKNHFEKSKEKKTVNDTSDAKTASTSKLPTSKSQKDSGLLKASKPKQEASSSHKNKPRVNDKAKDKLSKSSDKCRNIPKRSSRGKITYKLSSDEDDDFKDQDFKDAESDDSSCEDQKKIRLSKPSNLTKKKTRGKNRKILSSDDSTDSLLEQEGVVCWCEIYLKGEQKWICIECSGNICNKPYDIEQAAVAPVSYVIAFDEKSYIKDVTKRYCRHWLTQTRKLRVCEDWWQDSIEPFLPPDTQQDRNEDSQMEANLLRKPLPQTIGEFKNHPLYALKRHLLKFEALYPPDAPPVGFIRGEPVYARECVHKLHSRETWVKEARLVRVGEQPYKIVKARPKWDRVAGVLKTDLPLELYGHWQTEKYMPPVAWNGKVPRNEYGNVELFKPCMLPVGTVHLRNPGLNRVAKKLGIDCCPAVVGFDGHKGSIHPVFDGFIVCEEFKDTVLAAWEEEQENIRKREEEKREKRVYGNWKRLIKGLLIRERIKTKYLS